MSSLAEGSADEQQFEGAADAQPSEITAVLNRPISQELLARDLTRLAYMAKDGTPRCLPIGFTWNGTEIVMCTTKNAPKLPALRHNPAQRTPSRRPSIHDLERSSPACRLSRDAGARGPRRRFPAGDTR